MVTFVVWLCAIPPSLALLYFSVEVFAGLRPLRPAPGSIQDVRLAIVIPAHDEELLIAETVEAVRQHIEPTTRLIVVADNCSDTTADLARSAGAIVIEREDRSRRGKGFALACARDLLSTEPPDAVFILDADCRIARGSAEAMASYAVSLRQPVQSANLLSASQGASALVLVSNFAMLIKNLVRARGLYRIGGGIPLFGTGMAFPWHVFSQLDLSTSEAVEDLGIALSLAKVGTKVHFYEDLLVSSPAAELADSLGQRTRWEHGFLAHAARAASPLFLRGLARRSRHLIALGAHLFVPPLALLFLLGAAALVPALALAFFGNLWPAGLLIGAFACALVATGLAWWLDGRGTLPFRAFVQAPIYVLWKLPLYLSLFSARQREWNRTRRVNEKN